MSRRTRETDPKKMWDILALVFSYGHTIPFIYKQSTPHTYYLSEGIGGWGWRTNSVAKTLLDDIRYALFERKLKHVELQLPGIAEGPICDTWTFRFTRDGLVEAYNYYNDD